MKNTSMGMHANYHSGDGGEKALNILLLDEELRGIDNNKFLSDIEKNLARGQACTTYGKYEKALEYYNLVLQVEKDNEIALLEKGVALKKLKRLTEALELYMRIKPGSKLYPIALNNIGNIYGEHKNHYGAFYFFNRALKVDPNYKIAKENRDLALRTHGPF